MCGTKNFTSVRLYSAPQSHWTIVVILRICAYGARDQAGFGCKSAMDMPRIKPTKTSTRGSRRGSEPDVSDKRNSLGVLNPSRHPRGGFLLPPDSAVAIWPHALRRSVASERLSPSSGFDWRWSDRQPAPRSASPVATRRFAGSIQPLRSVASQTTDQPVSRRVGPDADRYAKLLIQFAAEGSLLDAYSQAAAPAAIISEQWRQSIHWK